MILFCFSINRISLPLMESIETQTSPKILARCHTTTLPRIPQTQHAGDSSDSDSETDTAPLGDTFLTR